MVLPVEIDLIMKLNFPVLNGNTVVGTVEMDPTTQKAIITFSDYFIKPKLSN
ncbi:hypothetical protein STRDD10_00741 [Streptococcus sp. DD10]|nr:hypothetical protein STRDD10_00741 [Streptococcus sp. DD10]